ncbi:hypothetical protein [Streptomyces catenulae]|uniref:Serine/arginine repetitive matrix protein 2 n=1 Tax=Streptomyces catenulae TaxID=66875 RepID=A0ABV2YU44_9ACTN|nr:hypothetical protein [Streptomyces catenulae]
MTAHGGGAARWNSETQQWDDGAPPPAAYTGPPPPRPAWTPGTAPATPPSAPAGGEAPAAAPAPPAAPPAATPEGAAPAAPEPAPYAGQAALDALPGSLAWDERPTVAGRRSSRRTAALAAGAAVAVIGLGFGGGWLLWGRTGAPAAKPAGPTTAASSRTSYPELPAEPTEPTPTGTGLPEGFHLVHNTEKDFTLAVPQDWQHDSRTDGEFYTSPDERGLVQVFEIREPDETPRHSLATAAKNLSGNPGYTEIERGDFGAGAPSPDAAKLVYAYDSAQLGERVQVVDCAFSTDDGRQFAVLVRGPATDWPQQETTLHAALGAFVPHA